MGHGTVDRPAQQLGPVALSYHSGHRGREGFEAVDSRAGVLEGADGGAHARHANSPCLLGGWASHLTGGMDTAMVASTGSEPSLR